MGFNSHDAFVLKRGGGRGWGGRGEGGGRGGDGGGEKLGCYFLLGIRNSVMFSRALTSWRGSLSRYLRSQGSMEDTEELGETPKRSRSAASTRLRMSRATRPLLRDVCGGSTRERSPGRSSKQVNGGALQSLQSAPNCSRPARQRAGRRAQLTHLHIMYMVRVTGHREHEPSQWSAEATGGT
jgi:hypothetical protein